MNPHEHTAEAKFVGNQVSQLAYHETMRIMKIGIVVILIFVVFFLRKLNRGDEYYGFYNKTIPVLTDDLRPIIWCWRTWLLQIRKGISDVKKVFVTEYLDTYQNLTLNILITKVK